MKRERPFIQKMVELEPTSAREAELAFLIYNESFYENVALPRGAGREIDAGMRAAHLCNVSHAVELMRSALDRGGPLGHPAREQLTRENGFATLTSWERMLRAG